ncbi:NUDIX domain-containing protein [Streptomyces sp. NPDC098789]|uniref:NUDIX domain-containing protein n=1 Tax=Streptomyces sp. NPDC098789 TaxID=3366098 RepID=UPI0038153522
MDERRQVLLQRRSAAGLWTPLSGILEPGEVPAAGVIREVEEETGVQVVVERLAAVTSSRRYAMATATARSTWSSCSRAGRSTQGRYRGSAMTSRLRSAGSRWTPSRP